VWPLCLWPDRLCGSELMLFLDSDIERMIRISLCSFSLVDCYESKIGFFTDVSCRFWVVSVYWSYVCLC